MSDLRESALLRELVSDYYNQLISFEEYRAQRNIIFDIIDEEVNGVIPNREGDSETEDINNDSSLINKAISFFKKTDNES
jgi:hypothetical protein